MAITQAVEEFGTTMVEDIITIILEDMTMEAIAVETVEMEAETGVVIEEKWNSIHLHWNSKKIHYQCPCTFSQ